MYHQHQWQLIRAFVLGCLILRPAPAAAQVPDLSELTLEQLMNIEVTSVTLRPEPLSQAAAAAYVITRNDIRRSGATNIPEALRMVPGLQVARLNAHTWAISARGFNGRFANKLLVLIDGRSVYTPFFSGVYWDAQNVMLEDVERIEVVRGPGATLWGTNAVNGVINIITRSSADSQGLLVAGGSGTEERGFGSVRYGGTSGSTTYRVYTRYSERDDGVRAGMPALDDTRLTQGGFRLDWNAGGADTLTLQGDLYEGESGENAMVPAPVPTISNEEIEHSGGNILARWTHAFDSSSVNIQFFYDRTMRSEFVVGREERDTVSFEFQNQWRVRSGDDLVWGVGVHSSADDFQVSGVFEMTPPSRTIRYTSAFVQYDLALSPTTRLTLGSKVEHNTFTGAETQPNIRFFWSPDDTQSAWAAVSRAVRMPSRAERDSQSIRGFLAAGQDPNPTPFPATIALQGSDMFDSENLVAYEGGWRYRFHERLSMDLAGFYNVYDDLLTREPLPPQIRATPVPNAVLNGIVDNLSDGRTYGFEGVIEVRPRADWRVQATYSYLQMNLKVKPGSGSTISPFLFSGTNPKHRVSLRSGVDLPGALELNLNARWVDDLVSIGVSNYFSGGARLGWRPSEHIELAIVGQDLLAPRHTEFAPGFLFQGSRSDVERSVYGKFTFEY